MLCAVAFGAWFPRAVHGRGSLQTRPLLCRGAGGYPRVRNDQLANAIENYYHFHTPAYCGSPAEQEECAMSHIRRAARQNKTMLMKTGSYYVIHICVAATVAYAVTGNLWAPAGSG
jgi:uncharacterized membrane protein YraQ (UPF0718 family)